jgi:pantetheine-phosphate adenylyltransferase
MAKKALYAGSFDPLTNGHLDLIYRASNLCDHLVVGVIDNPQKSSYFTIKQREDMLKKEISFMDNIEVVSFVGLLADYVNDNGFDIVVRGLRATMDFEYEIQMAQMNARLYNKNVETIFLMTNPKYSFISSSMIKEVFSLNGDISGLVPENTIEYMKNNK